MTEYLSNEVKGELEEPRSFTRRGCPHFDLLTLRALVQHCLLRRGMPLVFDSNKVESRLARLLGQVALILGMTYAECGDGAKLTDDEALMLIREVLLEADPGVIERHKGGKLPRSLRRVHFFR